MISRHSFYSYPVLFFADVLRQMLTVISAHLQNLCSLPTYHVKNPPLQDSPVKAGFLLPASILDRRHAVFLFEQSVEMFHTFIAYTVRNGFHCLIGIL